MTKERSNGQLPGIWLIGIDIGYSAVKYFSPNGYGIFPYFARQRDADLGNIGTPSDAFIQYTDADTGEVWTVGSVAQDTLPLTDTSDSDQTLYGRSRYTKMFRVCTDTGLAFALTPNQYGSPDKKTIHVQSGLPPEHMDDEPMLREMLEGRHHFFLQVGSGSPVEYDFTIDNSHVDVMKQPMGSLFSVSIGENRRFVKEASSYFNGNVIVFDPGFVTLDIYPIQHNQVMPAETNDKLGMKQVLTETTTKIREKYGTRISVNALQRYLESGKFRCYDRKHFTSKEEPLDDILSEACVHVFEGAMEKLADACPLYEYDYLIVTGGTGAAWNDLIRDRLKGMETLKILNGNQNDPDISFVFANVRGYYMYRYLRLAKTVEGR